MHEAFGRAIDGDVAFVNAAGYDEGKVLLARPATRYVAPKCAQPGVSEGFPADDIRGRRLQRSDAQMLQRRYKVDENGQMAVLISS